MNGSNYQMQNASPKKVSKFPEMYTYFYLGRWPVISAHLNKASLEILSYMFAVVVTIWTNAIHSMGCSFVGIVSPKFATPMGQAIWSNAQDAAQLIEYRFNLQRPIPNKCQNKKRSSSTKKKRNSLRRTKLYWNTKKSHSAPNKKWKKCKKKSYFLMILNSNRRSQRNKNSRTTLIYCEGWLRGVNG